MNQKILITFAGAVGTSKTPITNFLSYNLNLPVYNNDAVRTEVIEDLGFFDEAEYIKRRDQRVMSIINNNLSFIYDASVDREWKKYRQLVNDKGYKVFIISLDLSKEFLANLYQLKGYHESATRIDELLADHDSFLKEYSTDANTHISDADFPNRLQIALSEVQSWLKK